MVICPNQEGFSAEMKKDPKFIRAMLLDSGTIAKLTEVFNKLMQATVKPPNPMIVLREELGDKPIPAANSIERLEHELEDAHRELRHLRNILKKLGVPQTEWEDWQEPMPHVRTAKGAEQAEQEPISSA